MHSLKLKRRQRWWSFGYSLRFGKTAMGIYIACKLKKYLVIVHKGLLNQWIEG